MEDSANIYGYITYQVQEKGTDRNFPVKIPVHSEEDVAKIFDIKSKFKSDQLEHINFKLLGPDGKTFIRDIVPLQQNKVSTIKQGAQKRTARKNNGRKI